jgi:hypothetical protein
MDQITSIITSSAMSILVVLTGIVVQAIKKYLLMRGGKKAIEIVEILAKNAVNATEQVSWISTGQISLSTLKRA